MTYYGVLDTGAFKRFHPDYLPSGYQNLGGALICRVVPNRFVGKVALTASVVHDEHWVLVPRRAYVIGGGNLFIPTKDLTWSEPTRALVVKGTQVQAGIGLIESDFARWASNAFPEHIAPLQLPSDQPTPWLLMELK